MENSLNHSQASSSSSSQVTFDSVLLNYQTFQGNQDESLRRTIIIDLNNLSRRGGISDKDEAIKIAQGLGAHHLAENLKFYQHPSEHDPFESLPKEMVEEIVTHLSQGPEGWKALNNFLRVNTSFYNAARNAPLNIDL